MKEKNKQWLFSISLVEKNEGWYYFDFKKNEEKDLDNCPLFKLGYRNRDMKKITSISFKEDVYFEIEASSYEMDDVYHQFNSFEFNFDYFSYNKIRLHEYEETTGKNMVRYLKKENVDLIKEAFNYYAEAFSKLPKIYVRTDEQWIENYNDEIEEMKKGKKAFSLRFFEEIIDKK